MFKEGPGQVPEHQVAYDHSDYDALESYLLEMVDSGNSRTTTPSTPTTPTTANRKAPFACISTRQPARSVRRWFRQSLRSSSNVTVVDFSYQGRKVTPLDGGVDNDDADSDSKQGQESLSASQGNVYASCPRLLTPRATCSSLRDAGSSPLPVPSSQI